MKDFFTLFKHEFKLQFPFKRKNEKFDLVGNILSLLISLLVIVIFIFLISSVVETYISVRVNKVSNPTARAMELLNVFYLAIIGIVSLLCVEKMRKTLTEKKHKELFLRLPVKQETIFLSKLSVLLIWDYLLSFFLIIPINIIFSIALDVSFSFWCNTFLVWLFLPIVPFLFASLLIIPYIKIIDFIKDKYIAIFAIFSVVLIGAFVLYSQLLSIVQELLETGSMKFLFNESFLTTLQSIQSFSYPANSLANLALGENMVESLIVLVIVALIAAVVAYFVTKNLYYITLYKNDERKQNGKVNTEYRELPPIVSCIKKEFISVFRDSKNVFSYFAIATAMPVMVYCCYTLFESLISNTIGLKVNFSLAVFVVLIFSVLTNTFCSTNVSRDGLATLKTKVLPIKVSHIMLAKVIFCAIISSLSVVFSVILLIAATSLTFLDGLVVIVIGMLFSITQIFVATRLDLNHAKVSLSAVEIERESSKTIAKVVVIGLLLAIIMGILSMVIAIFAQGSSIAFIVKLNLKPFHAYFLPLLIAAGYFAFGLVYYNCKIEESFARLVM